MIDAYEAVICVFAGVVIGVLLTLLATTFVWHIRLIERGHAEYCPKNGEWAFKGECE